LYVSKEVHSYYFQVGVETGLLGLLTLAGIWLSFLYYVYKLFQNRTNQPEAFQVVWVLCAACFLIGSHALIDFDLSLSTLAIVMWSCFGIITSYHHDKWVNQEQPAILKVPGGGRFSGWAVFGLVTLVSLVVVIFSVVLLQANAHTRYAGLYIKENQLDGAQYHLEKALAKNPLDSGNHSTLSQIYRLGSEYEQSLDEALRAVELSPYHSARRVNLANAYMAVGEYASAVEQAEKALELGRFDLKMYEQLGDLLFTAGYQSLDENKRADAREFLGKASGLPSRMDAIMTVLPEKYGRMWRDGPRLVPTGEIYLSSGAAKYLLGDNQAEQFLREAIKNSAGDTVQGEALVWLAVAAEHKGQSVEADKLVEEAAVYIANARESYEQFKKLPILK